MFGGNMMELLQQAQKIKGQMQTLQDALADKRVEATSGGGMVKAVANGKQRLISLSIEPEVLKDATMAQDLIVAAVNQALQASQEMVSEEMSKVMGNLGPMGAFLKGGL
jgi:nucleoid-associated protein EbfC